MRHIHYTVYREDSDYVAQCLDYDVSSFGATKEEALAMLKEAVELYLEDEEATESFPHISELSVGELAIA
jgi:predicted RNase H-like HicB family nuclease